MSTMSVATALSRPRRAPVPMRSFWTLILLLGSLAARPCAATSADPLDIDEAIRLAVNAAPELTSRAAAAQSAQALVRSAGQLPDPELSLDIGDLTGLDVGSLSADDFTRMRRLAVMQQVPRRDKRQLRTRLATDRVSSEEAERASVQLDVARQAAQAWVDLYFASQSLQHLRELTPQLELQERLASTALESGRASTVGALAIQAAVVDFQDRLLLAEQQQQQARIALQRWLASDAERPLTAPPSFSHLDISTRALIDGVHEHAALQPFEAQLDVARTEVELAKAQKRPDWSIGLDYGRREPTFSDMLSLQFRVSLPLWTAQRQDPVISSKYAALRQVEAEREAQLRWRRAEVIERVIEWQTLQQRIGKYEASLLPLLRARTQAAHAAYATGRQSIQPLLDARIAEVDAQLRCLELQRQLGNAWAFLSHLRDASESP